MYTGDQHWEHLRSSPVELRTTDWNTKMTAVELEDISLIVLVAILHAIQAGMTATAVAVSRRKYKIDPPETTGPPDFLRTLRAQQNDLEFAVPFQIVLWSAGLFFHQGIAAILGVFYLYARHMYAQGYMEEAKKRVKGFHLSMHALKGLLACGVLGVLNSLAKQYFQINVPAILLERYYGTK